MEIGYFLSSEDNAPADLIEQAKLAEEFGFGEVMISDHFHPWLDRQGHAPFVWSIIGALSQATSQTVTTGVTCPTVRIHPAVIAQAAATSAVLLDGRFRLGVGSGENLNEHITGVDWPDAETRLDMLEEAVGIIRQLWKGDVVRHNGRHYTVRNARVYDLPAEPPDIVVSGFGPKSAALAGRIGDGYVNTGPDTDLIGAFEEAGGAGKLKIGAAKACFGNNRDEAARLATELWATMALPGELSQELPTPQHFEQAVELVTPDRLSNSIPVGDDPEEFVASFQKYDKAGFDLVFVQQIGDDQRGFFEFFRDEIAHRL